MSSESSNSNNIVDLKAESTGPALTPGQLVWRRFRKHKMALAGAIGTGLLLLFIIVGTLATPLETANSVDLARSRKSTTGPARRSSGCGR